MFYRKIGNFSFSAVVLFFVVAEILITTGKKRYSRLLAGNWQFFVLAGNFHYGRKKKDTLRPEKKRYSRLSDGCAVLAITTGKKKIQSSVWRVVLLY